jgi:hypothetical protein
MCASKLPTAWSRFGVVVDEVELVVRQHALRDARVAQRSHELNDARRVRATVDQVAKENKLGIVREDALPDAELLEQRYERV